MAVFLWEVSSIRNVMKHTCGFGGKGRQDVRDANAPNQEVADLHGRLNDARMCTSLEQNLQSYEGSQGEVELS